MAKNNDEKIDLGDSVVIISFPNTGQSQHKFDVGHICEVIGTSKSGEFLLKRFNQKDTVFRDNFRKC